MWEALGFVALVLVVVVPVVPAYVLLVPPVVMARRRRLFWPALVLWALSLLLLLVWEVGNEQFNERADVEGTAGDAFAAAPWLVAAVVVASASLAVLRTRAARASVAANSSGSGATPPGPAEGGTWGGRALALTGLACAAASVLLLPQLLSLTAVVLGVLAHHRGERLGRFVVAAAVVGVVLPFGLFEPLPDQPP